MLNGPYFIALIGSIAPIKSSTVKSYFLDKEYKGSEDNCLAQCTIERTPEEWGYVAPEEPQDVPVEEDEERIDPTKDPLLDFFSGYKTLVTGTLAFISAFFTNIFDTLGLAEAEKYGTLAMQAFLILAAVFLAVKFWKRLEAMLARRVPKK